MPQQKILHTIQSMINSLPEGFIVFDAQGICSEFFSKRAGEMFSGDVHGRHICDLMNISHNERLGFMEWYEFMFTPGANFEDIVSLGPTVLDHPSHYITLKFKPVVENGKVTNIVLILTDQTAEKVALREAEEMRSRVDMLTRFFADRENFIRVLESIHGQLQDLKVCNIRNESDCGAIFRQFHNIKGLAASLFISELVTATHDVESGLAANWERSKNHVEFENLVQAAACLVLEVYGTFREEYGSAFGLYQQAPKNVSLIPSQLLYDFYHSLGSEYHDLREKFANEILKTSLVDIMIELKAHAESMARSLGKNISVQIESRREDKIFGQPYRGFLDSLFHLINNCIDHGFPKNKPENQDQLTLGARLHGESLILFIEDNGDGIDPEQIRQKLYQKSVNSSEKTDAQVIYHIFDPGFSTKDKVSKISGRGMGLDAVHYEVKRMGGKIEVRSEKGKGTRFDITVPYLSPVAEGRRATASLFKN
jgi:two-component system chemotaxis sensor kinase CheA